MRCFVLSLRTQPWSCLGHSCAPRGKSALCRGPGFLVSDPLVLTHGVLSWPRAPWQGRDRVLCLLAVSPALAAPHCCGSLSMWSCGQMQGWDWTRVQLGNVGRGSSIASSDLNHKTALRLFATTAFDFLPSLPTCLHFFLAVCGAFTVLVGIPPRKMQCDFLWQWGIGLDNTELTKIFL